MSRRKDLPATPAGEDSGRREGRLFVTLPRLLQERLRATLEARGWIGPDGRPDRGAETEIVIEWLVDYARLQGWTGVGPVAPPTHRAAAHDASRPADEDGDFGFAE